MAAGAIEADGAAGSHGVLALVAVVKRRAGPQDLLHLYIRAAQAFQGVLHPLALGPKLLGIAQVLEVAAAAFAKIGAFRLGPLRGGSMDFYDFSGAAGFHHLCDPQVHGLTPDSPGHEDHGAVQTDDAAAIAGVALHGAGVNFSLFQGTAQVFHRRVLSNKVYKV